jgi:NADH-quinone oxidoreductase subunit J
MPLDPALPLLAVITLGSALAAMVLRNLVHCALCLVLAFVGLASIYLELGAAFVGFAQVLVYVGAISILIVFAILLTRGAGAETGPRAAASWPVGLGTAGTLCLVLAMVLAGGRWADAVPAANGVGRGPLVRDLGIRLLTEYLLPLELIALLLTAALIGAAVIAMPLRGASRPERSGDGDSSDRKAPPPPVGPGPT